MLKIYDVKCDKCGKECEIWIDSKNDMPNCSECGGQVYRIYSTFNFKLKYDNKKDTVGWSFNNYEKSRYWDDVNAERAKGRDVKPTNE